jgi:hypothetical protein
LTFNQKIIKNKQRLAAKMVAIALDLPDVIFEKISQFSEKIGVAF